MQASSLVTEISTIKSSSQNNKSAICWMLIYWETLIQNHSNSQIFTAQKEDRYEAFCHTAF